MLQIQNTQTMSSREIAELTKKEHGHVKRDIETMFKELEIDVSTFGHIYKDSMNRDQTEYLLDKENTLILVSGYNVKIRQAIIKRWQELENKQVLQLPNFANPAEAAIAWAHQYTLAQEAIATKAEIGNRRQATAMNTASQLSKQLDKAKDFATIKRIESITGTKYNWRELKKASVANDYPVNDVFDANYGTVKSYHADAWLDVYGVDITEFRKGN